MKSLIVQNTFYFLQQATRSSVLNSEISFELVHRYFSNKHYPCKFLSDMEPPINFHYFANFNSFETTEDMTIGYSVTFQWTDAEIARLVQVILRPIPLIVGTSGNCLTIYIMRRTSLRNVSSCFYMSLLALTDTSKWTFLFFSVCKLQSQ